MAAFYRKYRSKSLDEVVGQDHITKTLALAVKNKKINHAYLFTGPRGVGKTSVARILAHDINNLPYDEESRHLDIIEIDAASNRRIDDIRDLREKVYITPVSAAYKVYIIDEVHMLTGESFNALLKTLEEPPAHAVFVLATTEVHKLPATIISRVQRFHFRPISSDDAIKHLREIANKEAINIDDTALKIIAQRGDGSFRDSISLLDQLASMTDELIDGQFVERVLGLAPQEAVIKLLNSIESGNTAEVYAQLQKLEELGISAAITSDQLISSIMNDPGQRATLASLVDELLEVPKSLQPKIKLAVILLKQAAQEVTLITSSKSTKKPAATIAQSSVVLKKAAPNDISLAIKPKEVAKKESDNYISVSVPVAGSAPDFSVDEWSKVLTAIHKTNPPIHSVLKRARVDFNKGTLVLTFEFKLHQKKMDDPKYKSKLTAAIIALGYACPTIKTVISSDSSKSFIDDLPLEPEADATSASVLAMMGGESIHA